MTSDERQECLFCRIIDGQMPSEKVYGDGVLTATLDIKPVVDGHVLLMPDEHHPIMPVIPQGLFVHFFGLLPRICGAIKKAMVRTGINVIIANGGVAGQHAPHFLVHLYPRERGDGLTKFFFEGKEVVDDSLSLLKNNLPIMMSNHFRRLPASWRKGRAVTAAHLLAHKTTDNIVYEDESVLCVTPKRPLCKGHLVLYSQEEERYVEKLSFTAGAHLFYTASYAATAVFEGLGAHGTNIILISGESDDNPQGMLCVHVIPRWEGDDLDLLPQPAVAPTDVKLVAGRIKDALFYVEHEVKQSQERTGKKELSAGDDALGVTLAQIRKAVEEARIKK